MINLLVWERTPTESRISLSMTKRNSTPTESRISLGHAYEFCICTCLVAERPILLHESLELLRRSNLTFSKYLRREPTGHTILNFQLAPFQFQRLSVVQPRCMNEQRYQLWIHPDISSQWLLVVHLWEFLKSLFQDQKFQTYFIWSPWLFWITTLFQIPISAVGFALVARLISFMLKFTD